MSTFLWKYFFENDIENFQRVLARAAYNTTAQTKGGKSNAGSNGVVGSPGAAFATSPSLSRSLKGSPEHTAQKSLSSITLNRASINWRDSHGVTLLHYIASLTADNTADFAIALLQQPLLDLYIQDEESGWTALHRALYFGNVTIARALMNRDIQEVFEHSIAGIPHDAGGLIKIKDREGNSPFDVYGASVISRNIRHRSEIPLLGGGQDDEDNDVAHGVTGDDDSDDGDNRAKVQANSINGDEIFAFGSNKNFTLGFGDEDDRQYPERIHLKRPEHLLRRLYREYQAQSGQHGKPRSSEREQSPCSNQRLPAAVQYRPIVIQDVQLSKLHSAILTTDPEANLYMCGFGSGGRLGTGDETTRFGFINVHGGGLIGKKIVQIGLGQNHSIAISSEGEAFTWGSNAFGQLGYASSVSTVKDEDPVQLLPKQVFGPLKREVVTGATASRIHSVVHNGGSLYTFGKNEGQLGLVDSDARSLAVQNTPRKVAASLFPASIALVSAIDRATVCLLENHDVWVFSNYGYTKLSFSSEGFSNYYLRSVWGPRSQSAENHICKIASGGDTICAMSRMGDVFTVHVNQKVEPSTASGSTTNPSKIRGALSTPQRVWSLRKGHMAVRDVDVGQDGAITICTDSGSVWRRIKRAKIKDAIAPGLPEHKAKDFKFSRVPGLTRIVAVRSNAFGSYAAVRRECDVLKTQIDVQCHRIWADVYPLLGFYGFGDEDSDTENPVPRFWTSSQRDDVAMLRRAVLTSTNLEADIGERIIDRSSPGKSGYNTRLGTTVSEVRIPVHDFMLGARSTILRQALTTFHQAYFFEIPDIMTIEYDSEGKALILFPGIDFISVINLVLYMYTDSVVDVWHHTRHSPDLAFRYRQIRTELMKIASHLEMPKLEQAVRVMTTPPRTLNKDLEQAIQHHDFFERGDVEIELDGKSTKVHSALVTQRCPFFEGLFQGRAAGRWLSSRREQMEGQDAITVDLKHVKPNVFQYILRYLYADTDESMFDDVVTPNLDSYLDLVMEVMSVANELMLDRLSQCCQKLLGRFVNARNVCQLLNAVAPCSITQFKDAALEYICLNLEGMLENHLLNELDEELMLELDEVVRQNQLACLPIARSGRAEAELIEHYPNLLDLLDEGKRRKVDSVSLQTRLHEREAKAIGGSRMKAAFLEDFDQSSPIQKEGRKPSRHGDSQSKSPSLMASSSSTDLMFEMDEDEDGETRNAHKHSTLQRCSNNSEAGDDIFAPSSFPANGRSVQQLESTSLKSNYSIAGLESPIPSKNYNQQNAQATSSGKAPWNSSTISTSKLDMKDIMAQASLPRASSLSARLAQGGYVGPPQGTGSSAKLSQRERKKQKQKQQQQQVRLPQDTPSQSTHLADDQSQDNKASPWQVASRGPKISLKEVLNAEVSELRPNESVVRSPSPLNLRQTVSGKSPATRRTVSGPAQLSPSLQRHSIATSDAKKASVPKSPPTASRSQSGQTPIQSIRHTSLPVEPSLQLSMADILSQQQMEKEVIKEAAAKRSLQEIQEEQAFQEWWDEESRKVREAARPCARVGKAVRGKGRGGSSGRVRGRGRGGGDAGESAGGSRSGKKVVHSPAYADTE